MKTTIAALVAVAAGASSAMASVSLVTSRGALPSNDYIDWGQFGPNFANVANPSNGTSNGGVVFQISKPGGSFTRLDCPAGWNGGFLPGDRLVFVPGAHSMTVEFVIPIQGAGMQIWRNYGGSGINVQIDAYDAGNVLLGSFSTPTGGGFDANNNQAAFVGVLSTAADIKTIVYTVSGSGGVQEFAGNRMDLVVPAPGAMALLGASGLLAARRRRRA